MTPAAARLSVPQNRWGVPLIVVLACLVPLLLTPVLPSVDFYAHIVRYNVLAHPEANATFYASRWTLLPNLGMDILGVGLLSVFPPLLAARILGVLVILAPVLGTMRLSHALHGRISLLAASMAGLLAFNLILFWGFANFLLGLGVALWSIGWWVSAHDRPRVQLLVMIPAGIVLLFIHGLVFALWGLLLAACEVGLAWNMGQLRPQYLIRRWLRLLTLAVIPALLFLQMPTAGAEGGITTSLSNLAQIAAEGNDHLSARIWEELTKRIDSILRVAETSSPIVDRIFGLTLWGLIGWGFIGRKLRLDRRLLPMAILCLALIWVMPPNLFGVGHLDERMPLLFLAVLIAGLSATDTGNSTGNGCRRWVVPALVLLFPLHILLASGGMVQASRVYRDYLSTIRQIDSGPMAAATFEGVTIDRDRGRQCKPLLPLLQLVNGTAVPTFADATQQPLHLVGPLAAAMVPASDARSHDLGKDVPALLEAGFSTVVACVEKTPPAIAGTTIIAHGPGWAIYRSAPTGPE